MTQTTPFVVAFYDGYDPTATVVELTWADLLSMLSSTPEPTCAPPGVASSLPTCAGRTCQAKVIEGWSPVTLSVAHRANENVRAVTAVVLDLDHISNDILARVRESISDYSYIIHSTHNHAPPDDGCYRLIMPMSRPATATEWPIIRRTLVEVLGIPADPVAKDLSRFYFLPTTRAGVDLLFIEQSGAAVDVEDALAASAPTLLPPPAATVTPPPAPSEPVDLTALRKILSDVRRSKANGNEHAKEQAAILGRALDGQPLADVGERHGARVRLAGMLAYQLPPATPWESVLEIVRPCLAATPLADGESLDQAIGKTRKIYEDSTRSRAAFDARRAEEKAKLKELVDTIKRKTTVAETAEELGDKWAEALMLSSGGVRGNEHNAQLILACAPEVRGTFVWNDVFKRIEVTGGPFVGVDASSLPGAVAAWMQRQYEFMGGEQLVGKALLRIARENPYDPIAEYLNELAWDGTPRLDTFLETYFSADVRMQDSNEVDPDTQRYVRALSRRWLVSLVARALRPGCKADDVLVLEGAQGIGKSRALEALVGPELFLSTALALGDKDTMQAISSAWLVELAEMASFKKDEARAAKQFLSNSIDKFRPPYGAVTEAFPRRCIFVATTNEECYLTDRTGNRRYRPVRVLAVDVEAILRDREHLLAEAVVAFRAGERWWLEPEEAAIAAREAELRLGTSVAEEAIAKWWYGETPTRRPKNLTMSDVAELAMEVKTDRLNHALKVEIGYAMRKLGFKYKQRLRGGVMGRLYEPTEEMLAAPVTTSAGRASTLALVQAVKEKVQG
jgi:predicted P-loop ATPase